MFGKKKLKTYLLPDSEYKIVEAFELGGVKYFMYENAFEGATGRQLAALAIYEEMDMRCDREYLLMHVKAMDTILSNPKKIDISSIVRLNTFLKERLEMVVLPEYIYKLASIMYFDETESPWGYNFEYNEQKIKKWQAAGGTLDFFSQTPIGKLMPSMHTLGKSLQTYLQIAKQVDKTHHKHLSDILLGAV